MSSKKSEAIDLGLAILSKHCRYGEPMTVELIAAYCDVSMTRIQQIEKKAIAKLRRNGACRDLRVAFFAEQHEEVALQKLLQAARKAGQ